MRLRCCHKPVQWKLQFEQTVLHQFKTLTVSQNHVDVNVDHTYLALGSASKVYMFHRTRSGLNPLSYNQGESRSLPTDTSPPLISPVGFIYRDQSHLVLMASNTMGWGDTPEKKIALTHRKMKNLPKQEASLPERIGEKGTKGLAISGRRVFVGLGKSIAAIDLCPHVEEQ